MAEIQNELRRAKQKLFLFEMEALNWVLNDLITVCEEIDDNFICHDKISTIKLLKDRYKQTVKGLTPKDNKQQKLFT